MKKNDKVKIIDTGDIWEGKTGTVVSEGDELITVDGEDLTEVTVRVNFEDDEGEEQHVNQIFARKCLELESEAEDLKESFVVISDLDDFSKCFLGKDCSFKGFDYDDVYCKTCQEDGEFDYCPEDKEEIEHYKSLENRPCKIVGCLPTDGFDECGTIAENFDRCFWDVDFGNGEILEAVCGKDLKVNLSVPKALKESLDEVSYKDVEKDDDIIKPYVTMEDIDGKEYPSWMFAAKIAAAEGISEDAVIEIAERLKYKIFCLSVGINDRQIIAAKGVKKDDIWSDYGDYVLGPATLYEVK